MNNTPRPAGTTQPGEPSRPLASVFFTLSSLAWPMFFLYSMALLPWYLTDEPGGDIYYIEYLPSSVAFAAPTGLALLPLALWLAGAPQRTRLYSVAMALLTMLLGLYAVGFRLGDISSMESAGDAALFTLLYFAIQATSASRLPLANSSTNQDPRFCWDDTEERKLAIVATCLVLNTTIWASAACGLLVGFGLLSIPYGLIYIAPLAAFPAAIAGVSHWAWHQAAKRRHTRQAAWGSLICTAGTLTLLGLGLGLGFILAHESSIWPTLGITLLTAFAGFQSITTRLAFRLQPATP